MFPIFSNQYFLFVFLVFTFVIGAKVFDYLFRNYIRKFTEFTKTEIDDLIFQVLRKPIYFSIILIGIWLGLRNFSFFEKYLKFLDKGFFSIFVIILAFVFSRILAIFISGWLKAEKKFKRTPRLIKKVVTLFIYLIAILVILDWFEVKITPLVASLGIGGMAIALALQSTLSNVFAGLHIISDKPIEVGDFIELEKDISGFVEDISWRSTRIRTLTNNFLIIPNSKLAESIILNQSKPAEEMSVKIECGVSYESDLEKVEEVVLELAKEIQKNYKGAVKEFEPKMRYHTFGDSNINFSVILRVKRPIFKYEIVHHFIKELKKRFDKENIEIAWPIRKIYFAKK